VERPREFDVVLEPQPGGGFTVYASDLPGCVSKGDTKDDALANIQEAIAGYLASLDAHGDPLPRRWSTFASRSVREPRAAKAVKPKQLIRVLERQGCGSTAFEAATM
jgi:predicted RNase H-like HicB family nuclease